MTAVVYSPVGGFSDYDYWTSSQYSYTHAYVQDFDSNWSWLQKTVGQRVRAIRSF